LQAYNDFLGYKGGIYRPHIAAIKIQGVHAVEIIGWGTDPDTKENYWTVKNSWGRDWGENGYGRIARGL